MKGKANMINVSIVLYKTPIQEVKLLVETLRQNSNVGEIWLIDNSELQTEALMFLPATYIFNNKNIGYGAGHNIALRRSIKTETIYHLVVNSDIHFDSTILTELMHYMDSHTTTGSLMPKVLNPNGDVQHLCKLLPSPFDLIIRRFLPSSLTTKNTARFELHSCGYDTIMNIPYLSGCFMFLRIETLKQVGIFDERFFMYPEDIDLTRRIHSAYSTEYYPHVEITHAHRQESYKSPKLLWIHITNMCKYFNKWGWIFDNERKTINHQTIKEISNKHHIL